MSAKATVLRTYDDVQNARPGLYVVHSGTSAYYPAVGFIDAGYASLVGEHYDVYGKSVTLRVKTKPAKYANPEGSQYSISIGQEFFVTALKDYSDWPIKWWREAIQNSVDAGSQNVSLGSYVNENGTVTVYCDDDGKGMDEETLINKFLVLGGTTKVAGGGTAGGFGKAKELLLLPWIEWQIHSRSSFIRGAGINYELQRTSYRQGTRLEVTMPADRKTDHVMACAFLEKSYLPNVSFTVNGDAVEANLMGDDLIDSVPDKADIYFIRGNKTQNYLYVRTHGLFMFSRYIGDVPGFVIAELTAPSVDLLTANRDGFRDYYVGSAIDRLAERIAKDNLSALKSKQGMIRQKWKGSGKFRATQMAASLLEQVGPHREGNLSTDDAHRIVLTVHNYAQQETRAMLPSAQVASVMLDQKFLGPDHLQAALEQLVWQPDFYIQNDISGFFVPKKFFPETMTPTINKLAKTWVELCRFVMMQLGSDEHFGVGFVFSRDTAAAALTNEDDEGRTEKWIMINPYKDMDSFDDVWRPARDNDLKWLYAAAIHECTHIADRISYHDESFAAALTRNMAKCADGYRKIRQIAGGIRMSGGIETDTD